jgi:hypothetical protein
MYSEVDLPLVLSMYAQSSTLEVMRVLNFLSEMKGKRKCGTISNDKYRLEAKKMYSIKDKGTVVPLHAVKTWESER